MFDVVRIAPGPESLRRTITLLGTEIRKPGLGKDITNKALKGLPGIQKEGGDGIITGAEFVLYRPFAHCRTLCLEFFGRTMANAAQAILQIREAFDGQGPAVLTALEHFDTRYVRAIGYRNKSSRTDFPQAVLLIDVEGDDPEAVAAAAADIAAIASAYDTEAAIARSEAERAAFWRDRKNLGAIARHTNAFKLNEDVVIPLEALPAFAEFIERLNLDKELVSGLALAGSLTTALRSVPASEPDAPLRDRLRQSITNLESLTETLHRYRSDPQRRTSFSAETEILGPLRAQFHGYDELTAEIERVAAEEQRRKIIIATHMHAGDGNVHVNIPVLSSDYPMLQEADATAAAAIHEAVRLGGVVSGEHGIGLTKLKFIDDDVLTAYGEYKHTQDPDDLFNPGKLVRDFPHHLVYTPSFRLLELEAYILEATDLKDLSEDIAACVRCGKCKPVCCTHIPAAGMLYNPRNKILAVGQITEAVLYHAQTTEMRSFTHFRKLKDISDHCTACHKCRVPCPVKIDFGKVTLAMRELQSRRGRVRRSPVTRVALQYLWRRTYAANAAFRRFVFQPGFALQRIAHAIHRIAGSPLAVVAPRTHAMLDGRMSARGAPSLRERRTFAAATPCMPS
jgi:FAD/FMN-containing dehydrogenase/ferredoxin